jgi:predicted Zn-dependent protease
MKRAVFPLLSLALGICVLGAFRISPAAGPKPVHPNVSSGAIARVLAAIDAPMPRGDGDDGDARRLLREGEAGTYIGEILRERDSAVAHWANRDSTPLTVWIQPTSTLADFSAGYVDRVREAFEEWDDVELPLHFAFTNDSADADVHVTWIDRFKEPISGRTRWARDDSWAITDADIILALHHSQGDQLDDDSVRAMALHEIGHLLGLDHTTDSLSIMAPKVRVRELTQVDRATARLLYALPLGPVR